MALNRWIDPMEVTNFYRFAENMMLMFNFFHEDRIGSFVDMENPWWLMDIDTGVFVHNLRLGLDKYGIKDSAPYRKAFKSFWYNDLRGIVKNNAPEVDKWFGQRQNDPVGWIVMPDEVAFASILLVNNLATKNVVVDWFTGIVKARYEMMDWFRETYIYNTLDDAKNLNPEDAKKEWIKIMRRSFFNDENNFLKPMKG